VINESEGPWWNDIDRGSPDSFTGTLWKSYQRSNLVANHEEFEEGNDEVSVRNIFVHTWKWFVYMP
jgi:hypothetical protein